MANIKILAMDVDGTLTDGKLYISGNGEEFKAFNVKDGYGVHEILPAIGITPIVVTGRTSEIVTQRCREIGICHVYQGIKDKLVFLRGLADKMSISLNDFAYIGDDDNDIDAMCAVSLSACPADASKNVLEIANFISSKKGGEGAVRDFIEWIKLINTTYSDSIKISI